MEPLLLAEIQYWANQKPVKKIYENEGDSIVENRKEEKLPLNWKSCKEK
jgi:hypothetical protein